MTDTPLSDDVVECAKEFLAVAHEEAKKPLVAIDIRTGNIGRQGVAWVETTTALAAIRAALEAARYGDAIEALTDIHRRVLCPVGPSPTIDDLGEIASKALESINGR